MKPLLLSESFIVQKFYLPFKIHFLVNGFIYCSNQLHHCMCIAKGDRLALGRASLGIQNLFLSVIT